MSAKTKGILAILVACVLWGCSGLLYDSMPEIPAFEIMAHRTLWAFVFFLCVLMVQGRGMAPLRLLRSGTNFLVVAVGAVMVGINWLMFVSAIQIDMALEASLGYFIYPLIAVMLGRFLFGERLGTMQAVAVTLAALAVVVLTAGVGVAPWLALLLAGSFALYGAVKKRLEAGPVVSVAAEALLLLPMMLGLLVVIAARGEAHFGASLRDSLLLMLTGPVTAVPLMLFSYALRRVSMATVGLLSYLNPSLQFLVATLIMKEPFGPWHAAAFAMIWTALALYTQASWRYDRAARRAAVKSSTLETLRR